MQVNSLEKLSKIHISMNEKLMNHFNRYFSVDDKIKNDDIVIEDDKNKESKNKNINTNITNNGFYDATSTCVISTDSDDDLLLTLRHDYISNGNIMSGYLLYDCKTYGKVILLYHSKCKYNIYEAIKTNYIIIIIILLHFIIKLLIINFL